MPGTGSPGSGAWEARFCSAAWTRASARRVRGEHVVGRHTLQHLAAEKHLQALKGRLAARLERWRPSRQGDGRKEGFGSRFHFPGIRCAHAGQFAAVEGVVRAGGLVEELARAVLELAVSLHRLPVDLVGEREMPVGETLTDAGSMLL